MSTIIESRYHDNKEETEKIYLQVESENVEPDEDERKKAKEIIGRVSKKFSTKLRTASVDDLAEEIKEEINRECELLRRRENGAYSLKSRARINKTVRLTVLGNGPIEVFMDDPDVSEIVVQRYDNIVIEKNGRIIKTDIKFDDEEHLVKIIQRIVQKCGRQINITTPMVDARLSDGSRVNAVIPPVSPDGATLTIRRFNNAVLTGEDYLQKGSLNLNMLMFLKACVEAGISVFVSGGTGTGKTTFLNLLSMFIPSRELIITIEDTCELKLHQPNVRRREVRLSKTSEMMDVDQKALVKNALRERPDRIILGETRDGSVVDLISAMSTGHEGSMSTIHANSPRNMVDVRIPILYRMNKDANFDDKAVAMQIAEAVQLIVQLGRFPDGGRKVTNISYIEGVDGEKVIVKDIFVYNREKKDFEFCGNYPKKILDIIRNKEIDFDMACLSNESISTPANIEDNGKEGAEAPSVEAATK